MLRRLFGLLILLALVAGGLYYWKVGAGSALPQLGAVGRTIDDARLHASVKTAFELNRRLHALDLGIEAENGVVTLRGSVPDAETQAVAERVAGSVPGVRQVVSHLHASPRPERAPSERSLGESLDDHALAVKVRLALSLQRELEGARVEAEAFRREVALSGEVRDESQRAQALATARDVPGVAGVHDRLRVVRHGADRRAAAERALSHSPSLGRYGLRVREEDGQLVLSGRVETGAEKELAATLAREAAGIAVVNRLDVAPRGTPR